ncbi:hypothetical protein SLE2022_329260 [Rubroshorea leprosula]
MDSPPQAVLSAILSFFLAVQDYSQCHIAAAALSPSANAVLITKADLEGYHGTSNENVAFGVCGSETGSLLETRAC